MALSSDHHSLLAKQSYIEGRQTSATLNRRTFLQDRNAWLANNTLTLSTTASFRHRLYTTANMSEPIRNKKADSIGAP